MASNRILARVFILVLSALPMQAAEAIVGRWTLATQTMGGKKMPLEELMLRVVAKGQTFEFAYSVPVNDIQFVSLRFNGKLDGTQTDITDANGKKIGTAKITKASASLYKITIQGPNKPTTAGSMTISADGKTLTSESQAQTGGKNAPVSLVQVFSRQ